MPAPEMCRWTLQWSNRHTSPPDGMPRVLVEQILPRGEKPEEIYRQHVLGGPYGVHFQAITAEPRQLSIQAKQSIRRKAAVRRIEKAAPLFAESLIAQTLANQPEYFGTPEDQTK